jgi:ATPase subunit of ABC transporter with duplicated ATPase domains
VVIISHDRYLLDVVADEIAEIEDGRITIYSRQLFGIRI